MFASDRLPTKWLPFVRKVSRLDLYERVLFVESQVLGAEVTHHAIQELRGRCPPLDEILHHCLLIHVTQSLRLSDSASVAKVVKHGKLFVIRKSIH